MVLPLSVQHDQLPKQTGGRGVNGTFLTAAQVLQISSKRKEPYATRVLFFYATGPRIGEAAAVKWSDFSRQRSHGLASYL
jgi:integrase